MPEKVHFLFLAYLFKEPIFDFFQDPILMARQVAGAVLVTGASSGIGEATALALDHRGFSVFAGVRREEDGERLRGKAAGALTPVLLDITEEHSITAAEKMIGERVGEEGLKGLVNNAGIAIPGPLEFVAVEDFRRQFEVNVIGLLAVTQAMLPLLRRSGGRIINVGSTSGQLATPLLGAYSASKFALEAMTDVLRLELRPWGIHVSIIEPGIIETPMWRKSIADFSTFIDDLPPRGKELYGPSLAAAKEYAESVRGTPAVGVAQVILHALTSRSPKRRYAVGSNARIELLAARVPAFLRDPLLSLIFPIGNSKGKQ